MDQRNAIKTAQDMSAAITKKWRYTSGARGAQSHVAEVGEKLHISLRRCIFMSRGPLVRSDFRTEILLQQNRRRITPSSFLDGVPFQASGRRRPEGCAALCHWLCGP